MIDSVASLAERHRFGLIRTGIIGALVCTLSLVGFAVTKAPPLFVVVALAVPVGVLAVTKHMELGLAFMLLAGVFVRFRIPTGTASDIVISMVICVGCIALWIVRMLVVERQLALIWTPVNLPLLAFIATVPVSWAWGRTFRDPFVHEIGHPLVSVAAGVVMMLLPACLLLVINNIRSVRRLQALVCILLAAGMAILIVDLGYFWNVGPIRALSHTLRTNGVIHVNSHGLLSMWCVAFALALALFSRGLHWTIRFLLILYAGAWVYWGFYIRISWLSGWVPAFAAAAVVAFFRARWLFFIVMLVLVFGAGGYYYRTHYQSEVNVSGVTRLEAYRVNWRITAKHLLFGTGPAGYASYYMSYFPHEAMASHSNYIDLIAQTGIVGGFFYLWFFGAQVWNGYRTSIDLKGRRDFAESLAVAVTGGTAGCIVAMALGDWLLPFAYTQSITGFDLALFNWFFMGSLWALKYHLKDSTRYPNQHQN